MLPGWPTADSPRSPTGRGSRLKPGTVRVRTPAGAPSRRLWDPRPAPRPKTPKTIAVVRPRMRRSWHSLAFSMERGVPDVKISLLASGRARMLATSFVAVSVVAVSMVPVAASAVPGAEVPQSSLGMPVFEGSDTPVPDTGVEYGPSPYLQRVFDTDVAAGAGQRARHRLLGGPDARAHRARLRRRREPRGVHARACRVHEEPPAHRPGLGRGRRVLGVAGPRGSVHVHRAGRRRARDAHRAAPRSADRRRRTSRACSPAAG